MYKVQHHIPPANLVHFLEAEKSSYYVSLNGIRGFLPNMSSSKAGSFAIGWVTQQMFHQTIN